MVEGRANTRGALVTSAEPELTPTKLALRRTVRAQREGRAADERARLARRIAMVALEQPTIRSARCVAAYGSTPEEPGTGPLREALRARGTRVLLPVVADDKNLDWAEDDGDLAVTPGGLRLPEPTGPRLGQAALTEADVVIVPALAVDTSGARLGQGRGYYDRALQQLGAGVLVLALVHDEEVLDASTPIPADPHDIAVHGAVTPTRWMFFRPH
jgi:5-formyltetrahydrofolate cyclo-ligase